MRKRKRTKSMDDVSVTELFDDFVDLEAEHKKKQMSDEEYIKMMVEKEKMRELIRAKRNHGQTVENEQSDQVKKKKAPEKPPEMDSHAPYCESDLSPEDEAVVEEIVSSQKPLDESQLTERMRVAKEFLEHEITSIEAKRKARQTLDKYRKDEPIFEKKGKSPVVSEKRAPIKRCQNCYFCAMEKKISGSCWCHCTNPARSTHAVVKGGWVKSRMNLHCWKPMQD
jgi:hypothetical protein